MSAPASPKRTALKAKFEETRTLLAESELLRMKAHNEFSQLESALRKRQSRAFDQSSHKSDPKSNASSNSNLSTSIGVRARQSSSFSRSVRSSSKCRVPVPTSRSPSRLRSQKSAEPPDEDIDRKLKDRIRSIHSSLYSIGALERKSMSEKNRFMKQLEKGNLSVWKTQKIKHPQTVDLLEKISSSSPSQPLKTDKR